MVRKVRILCKTIEIQQKQKLEQIRRLIDEEAQKTEFNISIVSQLDESDNHEFEKFSQVILGDSRRKII